MNRFRHFAGIFIAPCDTDAAKLWLIVIRNWVDYNHGAEGDADYGIRFVKMIPGWRESPAGWSGYCSLATMALWI